MSFGEGAFAEGAFAEGLAPEAISTIEVTAATGTWGSLVGLALESTVVAVPLGAWGVLSATLTAIIPVIATAAGTWGRVIGVASASSTVHSAVAEGVWDKMYGDAVASVTVHQASAGGTFGRLWGQARMERVESTAAWELIAGFSTIRSTIIADLADA